MKLPFLATSLLRHTPHGGRRRFAAFRWTSLALICACVMMGRTDAQILYVAPDGAGGNGRLHQINANGTGDTLIPQSFPAVVYPVWSHDGAQFALTAIDPARPSQVSLNVFALTSPAGTAQKITNFLDSVNPGNGQYSYTYAFWKAFSPNRSQVAVNSVVRSGGNGSSETATPVLQIFSVNGQGVSPLVYIGIQHDGVHYDGQGIDWSPTQNVLVAPIKHDTPLQSGGAGFGECTALFLIDPSDGAVEEGRAHQLTVPHTDQQSNPSTGVVLVYSEHDYQPRFSPSGTSVAYVRAFEQVTSIRIKPDPFVESLHIINVTTGADTEVLRLQQGQYVNSVDWSPDGAQLVFDAGQQIITDGYPGQGSSPQTAALFTINLNGTGLKQVHGGGAGQPAWRPMLKTPPANLGNISTRANVLAGDNVVIGGFIVTGTGSKKVIVRGLGPSLSAHGVTGALADPTLELHNGTGALILSNDNWKATQQAVIQATGIPPTNDKEAAILATLAPGSYTAILRGKSNGTGVGLIEVYDLDSAANSKLGNISTRSFVNTGDNVLIGGLIVGGNGGSDTVLVRAIGPSLTSAGVAHALPDPTLELHNGNGALISSNDNWKTTQLAAIQATGIPPKNDKEAAILATVASGNYTAIVRGKNNTTGVGLVEVYQIK